MELLCQNSQHGVCVSEKNNVEQGLWIFCCAAKEKLMTIDNETNHVHSSCCYVCEPF